MPKGDLVWKTIKLSIMIGIFCASILYIAYSFQWRDILNILKTINPIWILIAVATILAYWIIRALRWRYLLGHLGFTIPFKELYLCTATALGLAIITPLQSGELLKIEMLKKNGSIERFPGYGSMAVERVCDLAALVFIAGMAMVFHLDGGNRRVVFWFLLIMPTCMAMLMLLFWKFNLPGKIGRFQNELRKSLKKGSVWLVTMLLTFGCWLTVALGWHYCLMAIGIDLGFLDTLMLTSITTIINVLSFIPGAVAVSEAGISMILLELGQPQMQAQAGAIVLRLYAILILICALLHYIVWRMRMRWKSSRM